uniref:Target of rapamycin complex subunit lst8 n=1 Tax=Sparus aurata TaxID=8175 RepID=A0A671W3E8_SPAAU
MNVNQGTVGSDPVILATAGYDHTVRFWQAHSGICTRTVQHQDSQVNSLEVTPDRSMIAAAGYQHIRMYDLNSNNPNPVINYDGVSKNITSVGFHEDGRWMYTGGEDCMARIWDLRLSSSIRTAGVTCDPDAWLRPFIMPVPLIHHRYL